MAALPLLLALASATTSTRSADLQSELAKEQARAAGEPIVESPSPAPEPEPEPTDTATAAADTMIRGNLVHVGTRELMSRYDHVGVRLGPHIIAQDIFLGVTPTGAFYWDKWAFGFHAPLNLLLLEAGSLDFGGAKLRRRDWDEVSDFAKVIRFITYGRAEEQLYFTVTNLRPMTLGHGQVMHNYQPNIDIDRVMTGLVLEGYNRWAGFQLKVNDIMFQNNVVGGLFFVKPLAFLDNKVLSSISLGAEYAADFRAPKCIQVSKTDRRCVPGANNQAGVDPISGRSRDDTFVRTDDEFGRPVVLEELLQIVGFSGEVKAVKTDSVDLKLYATFHKFIGGGDGLAAGTLARMNFGKRMINAFRLRGEGRSFSNRFQPAYFDTLYEITKYQTIQAKNPYQIEPTKYQSVLGDPDNGFVLADTDRHLGYNVELEYALFSEKRSNKQIALGVGLTDSTADNDTNFYAHLELPLLQILQVFGTFMRVNAPDLAGIGRESLDNVVALAGLRFRVVPFMSINASYAHAFQIIRSAGREFHLGNDNIVDELGRTSPYFTHDRIYEAAQTLMIDIEFGMEFSE